VSNNSGTLEAVGTGATDRPLFPLHVRDTGMAVHHDRTQVLIVETLTTLPASEVARLAGLRSADRLTGRVGYVAQPVLHRLWTHGPARLTLAQSLDATGLMLAGPRFEGPFVGAGVVVHTNTMPVAPAPAPAPRKRGTWVASAVECRTGRRGPGAAPSRPFGGFVGPGAERAARETTATQPRIAGNRHKRGRLGKKERAMLRAK